MRRATGGRKSLYTIKTLESYASTREEHDAPVYDPSATGSSARRATMIIYREDDKKEIRFEKRDNDGNLATSKTCGAETLDWNVNGAAAEFWRLQLQKRKIENSVSAVGGPGKLQKRAAAGCPTRPKTLRMVRGGVAADCSYVATYGSPEAALRQIITNMALASRVYENTFNVALSLIRIEIRAACYNEGASAAGLKGPGSNSSNLEAWNQPCVDPAYTINRRLSDFSKWRGERSADDVGLWHLMTRCSSDSTVGISWLNMLCQTDSFSQGSTASPPVPKNGIGQVAVINAGENKLRNLVAGAGKASTESAKSDTSRPKVVALAATNSRTKNAIGGTAASDFAEF
ncbi:MAG: Metallo-peptidase family M12B Reprolysin-like-domain-containing protein, partial [Olpidium bornovanus]